MIPQGLNLKTNTRYGEMFYNKNDNIVGKSLDLYGEWSQIELDFIKQYIHPGDFCVDAGAYIGTHTLCFLDQVGPEGAVLAFEMQHFALQLLCANISMKNHPNGWVFPCALSNKKELLNIAISDRFVSSNHSNFSLKKTHAQPVLLPSYSIPLDSLLLKKLDFFKIDVEGFEYEILEGAQETIRLCKPLLFIEYHPTAHTQPIVPFLQKLGYSVYLHKSSLFNELNLKNEQKNVFGNYKEESIFCVPNNRDLVVDLPQIS